MPLLTDKEKVVLYRRYPEWEKQIRDGDFRVEILGDIKNVVWPNTSIFFPSHLDVNTVISKEFPGVKHRSIKFTAGGMSLIISGPNRIPHE